MKSKEEIEKLAEKEASFTTDVHFSFGYRDGYIKAYTQCQQDMADKKYTEEDMLKCWNTAWNDAISIDFPTYKPTLYEDFINSLNKQD